MKTIEENIEAAKLYISEAAKAELREEGRRMERHELLRWRDPKEELPKGSEKVLVKYGLANGTIKYGIGEIDMVYKFLGNSPTFIIEGSCHREVALWRPIEEE